MTNMADIIAHIGKSIIQHGKENNRIYLMKLYEEDMPQILDFMEELAKEKKYSKIFAKIPSDHKDVFENREFEQEGYVPNFYHGKKTAYFMAKYLDFNRKMEPDEKELEHIKKTATSKQITNDVTIRKGLQCRVAGIKDVEEMTTLYKKVFETYPFPIHDQEYLIKTMKENIVYFGIWEENKLIALSSSEMDVDAQNVEMTDFAVDPEYRGSNLAIVLLDRMEAEMKSRGMKVLYTIARSKSYGMNITFAKMGYTFTGRLKNNTHICGTIESMNIWYKSFV